jgi:hypothetical protein
MATINQVFQSAPIGRRIFFGIAFTFGALLVVFGVNFYFAEIRYNPHVAPGPRLLQALAPLVSLLFVVPSLLFERSRISQFRIEDNTLVLGRKRYPLAGLLEVGPDPTILRYAIRKFGNGGLGAIRGSYWSKRVGSFHAFLTDTEKAVVLRWPDKVVAVSPADTEFFMYSVRAAAGLK